NATSARRRALIRATINSDASAGEMSASAREQRRHLRALVEFTRPHCGHRRLGRKTIIFPSSAGGRAVVIGYNVLAAATTGQRQGRRERQSAAFYSSISVGAAGFP